MKHWNMSPLPRHARGARWDCAPIVGLDLLLDVVALLPGAIVEALSVAPGELAEDVALLGGVTTQLRQPGIIGLQHACTPPAALSDGRQPGFSKAPENVWPCVHPASCTCTCMRLSFNCHAEHMNAMEEKLYDLQPRSPCLAYMVANIHIHQSRGEADPLALQRGRQPQQKFGAHRRGRNR